MKKIHEINRQVSIGKDEADFLLEIMNGNQPSYEIHSDSFVKYFIVGLFTHFSEQFASNIISTDSTTATLGYGGQSMYSVGAVGDTSVGLLIGTGATVETISDTSMKTQILNGSGSGQLSYGASSVAPISVSSPSAEIVCTRTFSNSSGNSITINEIGIAMYDTTTSAGAKRFLGARDLQTLIVNNGNTLTLNYKIRTALGITGGFVRGFLDILYRFLTNNSLATDYVVAGLGGKCGQNSGTTTPITFVGEKQGIVVGTSITPVNVSDSDLGARITHGTSSGTLYCYGTLVDNLVINTGTNTGSFDIIRIFENLSGGSITVTEIGVFANYNSGTLIFHDIPSSSTTVNNGELLKVKITFNIVS